MTIIEAISFGLVAGFCFGAVVGLVLAGIIKPERDENHE